MPDWLLFCLFVCASAGIVCEVITIVAPDKIIALLHQDPDVALKSKFYRIVFIFSGFYILGTVFLLFSGVPAFVLYGLIILCLSIAGWLLKARLQDFVYLVVAESTVNLIILIDIVRKVLMEWNVL
jgi:hypothetical protein